MSSATTRSALVAAAEIGPYFAWRSPRDGEGWRPLTALLEPETVADRVAVARSALLRGYALAEQDVPVRVVASIVFLGVASRLLSPPLGAAVVAGVLPLARVEELWWRPVASGPLPVAYGGERVLRCGRLDPPAVAGALVAQVVAGPVAAVLATFQARFRLSPQVLWGNVASALAGAAGVLADTEPRHAGRVGAVLDRAFDRPPLARTGTVVRPDPARPRRFLVRRSCCLYYRIPGGAPAPTACSPRRPSAATIGGG
ncbi:(2Fe-2S)-binding protein [Phytohabitans suffuscus]|uniref:(2Fe-2S)-binding protein n=1 Tax=Phytohabitans suffuscus TaxID=624315 RepID=UPI001567BB2F|nr:(2Fe-2S)-binding protein [Phytohabitans suffuscus]